MVAALTIATPGDAQAQGTPATPAPLLRRVSPELQAGFEQTPAFLRDSKMTLNLRTYYRDNETSPDKYQRAWAGGGSLAYQSGWLADVFSVGTTYYTSQPIWAPKEHDGTKLLRPGQDQIDVIGEAFAKFRYAEQGLTLYRQKVDLGYVNQQDNRMVPRTVEAATLAGGYQWLSYTGGYLWGMKERDSSRFIPMSQIAGAANSNEGAWIGGVRLTPWQPLFVEVNGVYNNDTLGIVFANGEYAHRVNDNLLFAFGLQYSDQRSVGADLIGDFSTWNAGARARVLFHGIGVELAAGQTSDNADIKSPYGGWPGYLSLINKDFNTAGQTAWGIKLTNDFSNLGVPGLTGFFWFADGTGAENPTTGNFREYDFDLSYAPPASLWGGALHGFRFQARVALVDKENVSSLLPDYRLIVNYTIPLL